MLLLLAVGTVRGRAAALFERLMSVVLALASPLLLWHLLIVVIVVAAGIIIIIVFMRRG